MPTATEIITYQTEHYEDVVALMAILQDHERSLSADRPPGNEVAAGHFKYLLSACAESAGQVFVALQDQQVWGFLVVITESEALADLHLYPTYKTFGVVTDLCVAAEARGQGIAAQLMTAAEDHCRGLGLARILVSALADNQLARDCYVRQGYQLTEVTFSKDLLATDPNTELGCEFGIEAIS